MIIEQEREMCVTLPRGLNNIKHVNAIKGVEHVHLI